METKLVLGDRSVYPSDEVIFSFIRDKKSLWLNLLERVAVDYPGSEGLWKFYNDGKQWLFRIVLRKKTLFWGGILDDAFRITYYFGDKAESLIMGSSLPEKVKQDYINAKKFGNLRPITTVVTSPADIDIILQLAEIKVKLK